ncbi:hypothetical protein QTA56_03860 [Acinetobacter sp. VNH17]|uniref:Uncharacterized protein n=1 Tax=Acinetobacter thutiue TaxID=2998078 RepID=A0ABT7WL08_9GAMM|nr:hypothetical protein [Acinetobacter thutiue]MCY6411276.1 hypothetical protein [Acinetobacter thutiue]MDN0013378.1 hypothetical protein [Acinetobacter thutiue]
MYFWNTNKLIDDLKNERLADRDYKNYYLVSASVTFLMMFAMRFSPVVDIVPSTIDTILTIIMLLIAVNFCFTANGGNHGKQFLNRLICLFLPIGVKMLLAYLLFFVFIIVALVFAARFIEANQILELIVPYQGWVTLLVSVFMQVIMYWRFYVAFKKINN